MIKCRDCGADQTPGTLFCSECGRFLLEDYGKTTTVLPFSEFAHRSVPTPVKQEKLKPVKTKKRIKFIIPSSRRRLEIDLLESIHVGRTDAGANILPELDLTQDNGADQGVSRLHATIQQAKQGIVLIDLGSTNGTSLNNFRIPADLPHPLHSGDEIRFGDLLVHIFFEE